MHLPLKAGSRNSQPFLNFRGEIRTNRHTDKTNSYILSLSLRLHKCSVIFWYFFIDMSMRSQLLGKVESTFGRLMLVKFHEIVCIMIHRGMQLKFSRFIRMWTTSLRIYSNATDPSCGYFFVKECLCRLFLMHTEIEFPNICNCVVITFIYAGLPEPVKSQYNPQ